MKQFRAHLLLLGLTALVSSVLYPLAVLAVARGVFPTRAAGAIVAGPDGRPAGSRLIAQEFKGDEWFQSRPSAVGYTANASGGSNWGANNPKLRERVETILKTRSEKTRVPVDAVTASGSGLDPHITLANARGQLGRVATAWATKRNLDEDRVRATIDGILGVAAFEPLAGLAGGKPIVNVFDVNLELVRRLGR